MLINLKIKSQITKSSNILKFEMFFTRVLKIQTVLVFQFYFCSNVNLFTTK